MREKFQGRGRFWFDKAHYPEPVVGPSAHKSILHGCSACAAVAIKRRREIARYLGLLALFTAPLIHAADPFELIPREDPLSPEDSLAAFEIDGDYRLELVAAEPLVTDPVEICFDERGRIYVAEMRDYPLGVQEGNRPQSRIRLLEDTDGDGRMDTSTIWADEIAYAQGISLVNGGLLVTSWDAILFLKDTDGDDVADYQQTLYRTNEPRHSQAIVSSPRCDIGHALPDSMPPQVIGAGLKTTMSFAKPKVSAAVFVLPLATSRIL